MLLFYLLLIAFSVILFLIIRSEVVLNNHMKIMNAIEKYVAATGDFIEGNRMLFGMENYSSTYRRFLDFSYKRIVAPEHLEKLMPYL